MYIFCILIKGTTTIIENETREQGGGVLGMLLATLSASLLRNMFVGKEVNRVAYETKAGQSLMPSNPFPNFHWVKSVHIRSYSGPHFLAFGLNTERYSISPYSVQMRKNADQNNSKYGHFSRSVWDTKMLPKWTYLRNNLHNIVKDGAYVLDLNDYKSKGTH